MAWMWVRPGGGLLASRDSKRRNRGTLGLPALCLHGPQRSGVDMPTKTMKPTLKLADGKDITPKMVFADGKSFTKEIRIAS